MFNFDLTSRLALKVDTESTVEDDLNRILNLPAREPYDCSQIKVQGKDQHQYLYPPRTQALIEIMNERFQYPRKVCFCRPLNVQKIDQDRLLITRKLPEEYTPEPPFIISTAEFIADRKDKNLEALLRDKQQIEIPAVSGGDGHPCITTLNASQAWGLYEAEQVGGLVAFAGVGSGKSILFLLAPLLFPQAKLAVLLIEPKQRRHYRDHYLRLREHFRVTSIVFEKEAGYIVPGTTPLHVISYSILSQPKNSDLLDRLSPDVLLLDECHRTAGKNSSINRRIKRFCSSKIQQREQLIKQGQEAPRRAVYVLGGSGTLEMKSIIDTQMLCTYSLGTHSPLPLDPDVAVEWAGVMDESPNPDTTSLTAQRLQHAFLGQITKTDGFSNVGQQLRQAFKRRRQSTLGIITSSAADVSAALYISERKPPKIPQVVQDALARVREEWVRPDGEELVERLDQINCARHVGCGFYNFWDFPKHPCTCQNTGCCDSCVLKANWYLRRKLYNKELRSKIFLNEVYLDGPKVCEDAAKRYYAGYTGKLPVWQSLTWKDWKEIEDKLEYVESVKWLDDWLARDAAEWAMQNKGVVWFQSTAMGRRIAELTQLPYFNGGPNAEDRLKAEKGNRSIICSIPAHGMGTDGLQYLFSDQLIVEVPASNATTRGMEQLLGRLHRRGQTKDVVNTFIYLHTVELRKCLRQVITNAEYNTDLTSKQKILCADLDIENL